MKEENVYFVGIGGIGMANLARYYMQRGKLVAGYDRTPTDLTHALEREGAKISYTDLPGTIPPPFRSKQRTLVVYTPAIPEDNNILQYFRDNRFEVIKRAALLGRVTSQSRGICVAGSHGKTTTCSMIAHILHSGHVGCNAFLGGILRNYDSNLIMDPGAEYSVIEADEYDRSFHQLSPFISVITSTDPDHLDIYGDERGYLEGFAHFTSLTRPGGRLLVHSGLKLKPRTGRKVITQTYSATDNDADYHAENIRYQDGRLYFDYYGPDGLTWRDMEVGVPIRINVDNAVAAATAAQFAGATEQEIRQGLATFGGAKRRFEHWLRAEDYPTGQGTILMDDYAHSPGEVRAAIRGVKELYPGKQLTVVFQPHLYTRTRDFAPQFAEALSEADSVVLCEIYPAREAPIPGVTSGIILDQITGTDKHLIRRADLIEFLRTHNTDVLMTLGAADINILLPDIKQTLLNK